jgi:hypothetical protein
MLVRVMQRARCRSLPRCLAAISLALFAAAALAQTPPPALDLRLHDMPVVNDDVATPGEYAADTETSVHGSVSTGVGYSKAFGRSTVNTADLDLTKRTDSGRTLDMHISVLHATGIPDAAPRDYVSRYPGH